MATVYNLLAVNCPLPIVPAALLSIVGGVPTVRSVVVANNSGSGSLSTPFNANAAALDTLGRAGAGAYAIDWDSNPASAVLPGLDLTVSAGLTLAIAAGQVVLDSVVQKLAATTLALTDNISRIYLWMNQAGVVTAVHNSTTPPAGVQVFLGSVVTAAGAITSIDGSGVIYFRSGMTFRRTADTAMPTDTPPGGIGFFSLGPSAAWLWDGSAYWELSAGLPLADTVIASGRSLTIPAGKQLVVAEMDVQGTLTVTGILKVLGIGT